MFFNNFSAREERITIQFRSAATQIQWCLSAEDAIKVKHAIRNPHLGPFAAALLTWLEARCTGSNSKIQDSLRIPKGESFTTCALYMSVAHTLIRDHPMTYESVVHACSLCSMFVDKTATWFPTIDRAFHKVAREHSDDLIHVLVGSASKEE